MLGDKQNQNVTFLLRILGVTLFLGRAWECFRWKTKLSNVIWDPQRFGKNLESIYGKSLNEIYSQKLSEPLLNGIDTALGVIFIVAAIACVLTKPKLRGLNWLIYLGTLGLGLVYFAMYYSKAFYFGYLLEHSLQMYCGIALVLATKKVAIPKLMGILKILTAITFVCHGLFAVGYYPMPGKFIDYMITGFGMDQSTAQTSLIILGILDFIFAILIFIPKVAKPALIYGIIWGFLTALARVWTTFSWDFLGNWFDQYFFEFVVRMCHFIVPLTIWLVASSKKV